MQELQRTTRESKHATERTAILAAVVPEKAHPFVLENWILMSRARTRCWCGSSRLEYATPI